MKIDAERNDFVVEDLDDQTLVIKEGTLHILKMRLDEVSHCPISNLSSICSLLGG
jgi:DNA-binding Xre family transcriptional regulator